MCGIDLDGALRHLAVLADHADRIALLCACDRLLGQGDGVAGLCLFNPYAQIQTGQQFAFGIGHLRTQGDLAGGGVHRQVREQQLSCLRVFRSIAEHQLDAGRLAAACALELPAFHGAAQLEHVAGRLGEVHVHRVDLLHHCQCGRFALADQGAFGDERAANTAGDGGGHAGIAEVDVGGTHGGLGGSHVGLGLFFGRLGVHKVLLADGIGRNQGAIAFCLGAGLLEIGLCLGQAGARALCGSSVGGGINAE